MRVTSVHQLVIHLENSKVVISIIFWLRWKGWESNFCHHYDHIKPCKLRIYCNLQTFFSVHIKKTKVDPVLWRQEWLRSYDFWSSFLLSGEPWLLRYLHQEIMCLRQNQQNKSKGRKNESTNAQTSHKFFALLSLIKPRKIHKVNGMT